MNKQIWLAMLAALTVTVTSTFCVAQIAQEGAAEAAQEEAAQENEPTAFAVAEGALNFKAPAGWTKIQPRINFIESEFSIPKVEGDPKNGRLTVMGAGGSIEDNIERWKGQFGGGEAVVQEEVVNGMTISMVDIKGTYMDSVGGPFNPNAKKVERENYRMVAAIIQTPENGNYFVKFYGPGPTVEQNVAAFKEMVMGLNQGDE